MPSLRLTAEQRAIIEAPLGHSMIRAVAGSGKTTTLAYRIRHLLEQGIDARRILVLMFNKSAQLDFQQRLQSLIQQGHTIPEVRTFHAMGFRLYQRFIAEGALPAYQGSILSEREIQFHLLQLMPQVLSPEQQTEFKRFKKEYLDVAARFIDQCKSQLDDARSFFTSCEMESKFSFLPALFDRFEQWRSEQRRISYADMLYDPVRALHANPTLKQLVSNKMELILVDEYQDTNDIQHALLTAIAGARAKVTVVGDPDQTIYEFRGAKPQYMLTEFAEEFPETQRYHLSTSFRYGHQIALLANQLISHSDYHDGTLCIPSEHNPKTQAEVIASDDELKAITSRLQSISPDCLANTAILVRYWSQTAAIELALLSANIPYTLSGFRGIFGSEEMQALRTLLTIASGEFKTIAAEQRLACLMTLGRFPHLGINERVMHDIMQALAQNSGRWGNHLIGLIPESLSRFQKLKLERFARALSVVENNAESPKRIFYAYVEETKLYSELKSAGLSEDASKEQMQTVMNLIEFMVRMQTTSAQDLLNALAAMEAKTKESQVAGLQLTTIHRAKGLEWDHVLLPGLSENTYFSQAVRKQPDVAGERRLLYVALTRAKRSLSLLCPSATAKDTLRFIEEMTPGLNLQVARSIDQQHQKTSLELSPSKITQRYAAHFALALNWPKSALSSAQYPEDNTRVTHKLLGNGHVVKDEGETFTVEFDDRQRRVFSKRYADQVFSTA